MRVMKISQELLSSMLQYLRDLKDDEEAAEKLASLSLQSRRSVHGMNLQEAMDGGLIASQQWEDAWNQPFRGQALAALETKLQLNADAICNDHKKKQMSRIIPVVQASGTGKSRMAEEYDHLHGVLIAHRYVKKNFAVMLSLMNGSSFPHRVYP